MAHDTTDRTDEAVRWVVRRLRRPAGESPARRLLAAVAPGGALSTESSGTAPDPFERFGARETALAAVRIVRRRLDYEVPPLSSASERLGLDPRDVAAAERSVVAELSPPADPDEGRRLDRAVEAAGERLDAARAAAEGETELRDADDSAGGRVRRPPGHGIADRRAHLGRVEADRSMASLGFTLYDIVVGEAESVERPPPSDPDRA